MNELFLSFMKWVFGVIKNNGTYISPEKKKEYCEILEKVNERISKKKKNDSSGDSYFFDMIHKAKVVDKEFIVINCVQSELSQDEVSIFIKYPKLTKPSDSVVPHSDGITGVISKPGEIILKNDYMGYDHNRFFDMFLKIKAQLSKINIEENEEVIITSGVLSEILQGEAYISVKAPKGNCYDDNIYIRVSVLDEEIPVYTVYALLDGKLVKKSVGFLYLKDAIAYKGNNENYFVICEKMENK